VILWFIAVSAEPETARTRRFVPTAAPLFTALAKDIQEAIVNIIEKLKTNVSAFLMAA
jgi:hypothetical protein